MSCRGAPRGVLYAVVCLGCIVFLSSAAAAQQIVSASISGTVSDAAGAVVPGASVRLVNRDTNLTMESVTDERGRFRLLFVPVGQYRLSAASKGFAATTVDVTLGVGQSLDLPIRLPAAVSETVTVTATVPLVDTRRTQIADTITPHDIDALPLNGRNYLDLALLAPNVSRTNTRNSDRFAETSAVPGTGISITGQRNIGNTFIVDGLSANDDAADLAGTTFSEDVIREFQVITSGGGAEFGRTSTGIVNIVTQSGSNAFRARGYGFYRNARWDAKNALATRKDPLTQSQFGASVSGPLSRDRLFVFGNVERTLQDKNGVVTITADNTAAINHALTAAAYPGPAVATGEFLTGYDTTNVFARADAILSADSRLQLRYSLYDVRSPNARGVGGLSATSRGTRLDNRDHFVAGSWQGAVSSRFLNEVRAQWATSDLAAPVNDTIGPAITISGVANIGTSTSSPTGREIHAFQVADTATLQRGSHLVKLGADALYNRVDIEFPGALQGSYTFTSLTNLERGIYQQFQQAFGQTGLVQSNPNLGLFVQDEWQLTGSVTVNAGLRYDLQWLPEPIALDANNVSPRLGVAWSSPDRQTVVRFAGGLYFDRLPLRATSNALQRDGVHYQVAVLSFGQAGAPRFPAVLPAFPDGVVTAITTIDPDIQNGRSEQIGVQVERALGRTLSAAAGYSYVRGHGIIMSRNVNVPTLTAAQANALGIPNLGRPNPAFANISQFEAIGDSWFDGLTLSLQSRAGRWGSARVSYTLATSLDTSGNAFFSTPQNNADIAAEKGPSDNDQRHRLVISGSVRDGSGRNRLGGLEFGYAVACATGVPFNVVAGSDLNSDTNNNDRPPGVSRNSERQPSTSTVDLRVSRTFAVGGRQRIQVMAEAFNLLNHVNVVAVNNTFGTGAAPLASFGVPTIAGDPRQLQAGVRWMF